MSNCIITKNHFPLVIVTLDGNISMEDIQKLMDECESLYLNKKDFYFIFNTLNLGKINFKNIFKIASFIKKMKLKSVQYLKRSIVIIDKTHIFQRNLIRLIFSIQSPSAPVFIAGNAEESLSIHTLLLNNKELPKHITCYK
jgi:hypothetical protein